MICFQNLYLWLSDTTWLYMANNLRGLWFAFKIYIFGFLIQLQLVDHRLAPVVICFQNLYLWLSDTTERCRLLTCDQLWFAFKIYIFGFLIQLSDLVNQRLSCCDLLSKFISLAFWYNPDSYCPYWYSVVICFQNLYLWLSDTTSYGVEHRRI